MKRFLIFSISLMAVFLVGVYLFLFEGLFIEIGGHKDVRVPFKTQGKVILNKADGNIYKPLEIKGVTVSANVPGKNVSDYAASEEDYYGWLKKIGNMGANTVKAPNILDDDFYNALYRYNSTSQTPLYLLQGIDIPDEVNAGPDNAASDDFKKYLINDGIKAVNVIHGRSINLTETIKGTGFFFKDISKWVIGYQVGRGWNQELVAYTNNSLGIESTYNGDYFRVAEGGRPFEAVMAEIMDEIISYETRKYKTQRIIGFVNDRTADFLEYEDIYARQLYKYAQLDAENVVALDSLESGYYAGYNISDFAENYLDYITEEQREEIFSICPNIDKADKYAGYLQILEKHHSMPVICLNFGLSTSRATTSVKEKPLTEKEQGEEIVQFWKSARSSGINGVILGSWQDMWQRRSWNTAFATDMSNSFLWHDLQTQGECYGILSFHQKTPETCIIDGDTQEWNNQEPVITGDGKQVFIKHDLERLYLMVKGDEVSPDKPFYIPFDLTEDLGSRTCSAPELTFDRDADFVLCVNGKDNTRLLVQERYDAMRQNFGYEVGGDNPYLSIPEKDSNAFVPILMAQTNDKIIDSFFGLTIEKSREISSLATRETGLLVHGNGNWNSPDYNSLTDFSFGDNCVEIGIPWLLLNISNPYKMEIHEDYYHNYGVISESADKIWLGIGNEKDLIPFSSVDVKQWNQKAEWEERLKQSYYVIKQEWCS